MANSTTRSARSLRFQIAAQHLRAGSPSPNFRHKPACTHLQSSPSFSKKVRFASSEQFSRATAPINANLNLSIIDRRIVSTCFHTRAAIGHQARASATSASWGPTLL
jgi:hypothetical protein